jgi:ABC-type multidrug transport system fused ATPase/permease subunit
LLLVIRGQISIGVFGASITAFASLQNGMKTFLMSIGRFPEWLAYAGDYYNFLDMPDEADGGTKYTGLRERITIEQVSFKYPNAETFALHNINLVIRRGEKIAVLGENGSGKTTLSKILLGLYPSGEGRVCYDGVPVESLEKNSFYAKTSAIAQDFVTYYLSIRENIALSDVSRLQDDEGIHAALRSAGAEDFGTLDDTLGREFGGRELSGGQWQKLAIARGLFRNSEFILLDEPTSALDPLIETEILTHFINAARDKTAFIISHRVGLCKLVDRIIVMKDGQIAEDGTHDELLAANGEYSRLYKAQAQWYQ